MNLIFFPEEFLNFAADEKYAYSAKNHESRIMNQGIKFIEAENIDPKDKEAGRRALEKLVEIATGK